MTENFTYSQGLIKPITSQSWFANPAGIEGEEVIILEKVGDQGSRYYDTLKPGQTLRFRERIFTKYDALAVDMRLGRYFQISGQYPTRDRGKKVTLTANIRYHVTDANILTLKAADPLGEMRDKVVAALNRDLAQYPEGQINSGLVEKIIRNVGSAKHLGLTIDGADITGFDQDTTLTENEKKIDEVQHNIKLQQLKNEADLIQKQKENDADIFRRQARHDNILLTDPNVLMHEHPELIQQMLSYFTARDQVVLQSQLNLMSPVIQAYIAQKQEEGAIIDPEELAKIIQRTMGTSKSQSLSDTSKQISWGEGSQASTPFEKPSLKFDKDDRDDENDSRIKFGDG